MADCPAPFDCPGHGKPCRVLTTKKPGPNKGRPFYACAQAPQCRGWFQWADEPPKPSSNRKRRPVVGTDVRLSIVANEDEQPAIKVEFSYDDIVAKLCGEFAGAYYSPDAGGWLLPMRHQEEVERRLTDLKDARTIRSLHLSASSAPSTPAAAVASPVQSPVRAPAASAGPSSSPAPPAALPPPAARPPPTLQLPPTLAAGLMPHQREAVQFVVANGMRGLIADDMGLGKTVTAIGALVQADEWPALVLCPSSVKYNWRAELLRWLPERLSPSAVQVVDGAKEPIEAGTM